jgi:hypothetical protein
MLFAKTSTPPQIVAARLARIMVVGSAQPQMHDFVTSEPYMASYATQLL